MAIVLNGINQYLEVAASPVSNIQSLSVAAWVKLDTLTGRQVVFHNPAGDGAGNHDWMQVGMHGDVAGDPWVTGGRDAAGTNASSKSATPTAGVWQLVGATLSGFGPSAESYTYLDGTQSSVNNYATPSATYSPANPTHLFIGARKHNGTVDHYCDGCLMWLSVWNAVLTADEMQSLAAGLHPSQVRPDSLSAHWAFGGFDGDHFIDSVGGLSLTAYNSPTWTDDSPSGLIYPSVPIVGLGSASPPVSSIAPHVMYYQRMMTG